MRLNIWRKVRLTAVLTLGLLGVASTASAALLGTYRPADADMEDLDHFSLYAWRIEDTSLNNKTIGGATLTFSRMYNWDTNTNKLYLYLLNNAILAGQPGGNGGSNGTVKALDGTYSCSTQVTASTTPAAPGAGCVTEFIDNQSGNSTATPRDDFNPANSVPSGSGWLVTATDRNNDVKLTERSFAGPGALPTSSPGQPFPGVAVDGWSYYQDGTTINQNNGQSITAYTYTYTFSQAELDSLNSFLAGSDNAFALGIDPDCHFYNEGITLRLYDSAGVTATPEPASMLLLGTGLLFLARRRLVGKAKA